MKAQKILYRSLFATTFNFKLNHFSNKIKTSSRTIMSSLLINNQVRERYEQGHRPLIAENNLTPKNFANIKALESWPTDLYQSHVKPVTFSDKFAYNMVQMFKVFNRLFFRDKYTHHAVVLETVAAVPGMVSGMLRHFKSLRRMERDHGWISVLLEEAENERMHLLTWMQVIQPTFLERVVVMLAQVFYAPFYTLMYIFSPKTAHRFVGYLEEEACHEYSNFLKAIDDGIIPNIPAPDIAKNYWNLPPDATLRDVVLVVRADEVMHKEANHAFSHKSREGLH